MKKMEQLKKDFEDQLILFNEGNLTSDDFFKWLCTTIEKYGGKLPANENDDETNPPNAKLI